MMAEPNRFRQACVASLAHAVPIPVEFSCWWVSCASKFVLSLLPSPALIAAGHLPAASSRNTASLLLSRRVTASLCHSCSCIDTAENPLRGPQRPDLLQQPLAWTLPLAVFMSGEVGGRSHLRAQHREDLCVTSYTTWVETLTKGSISRIPFVSSRLVDRSFPWNLEKISKAKWNWKRGWKPWADLQSPAKLRSQT